MEAPLLTGMGLLLVMAVRWVLDGGFGVEGDSLGLQVFCGKIPKDMYEDELIPHFEKCGRIWDLRLMMDPMSGLNRFRFSYSYHHLYQKYSAMSNFRQVYLPKVLQFLKSH